MANQFAASALDARAVAIRDQIATRLERLEADQAAGHER